MQTVSTPNGNPAVPYLEHYPEPGGVAHRIPLDPLPFRLGRSRAAHYIILSSQVSKEHAVILRAEDGLRIRDLGSTNGTFVNGQLVTEAPLTNGDIVHVGHKEFRFVLQPDGSASHSGLGATEFAVSELPRSLIHDSELLRDLLRQRRVNVVFQPIVWLEGHAIMGYESLGRGSHAHMSAEPADLFDLAERCRLAPELSRLFRTVAIREAAALPGKPRIFFNLHPAEMKDDSLMTSLREVSRTFPERGQMVLEVHEDVVADMVTLRRLRERLRELGIGLAYDDFGAGQSRLAELAEVPPDFVKLDMKLIRGIDRASSRQALVRVLVQVGRDNGVQLVAEGLETHEEAETCHRLGCQFGQGYLFGRPRPAGPAILD
jgi:EAL domain-containing protein (putative c-di-GMP-specific phosphodiesterase class I)